MLGESFCIFCVVKDAGVLIDLEDFIFILLKP
jgi:hypothetical protein